MTDSEILRWVAPTRRDCIRRDSALVGGDLLTGVLDRLWWQNERLEQLRERKDDEKQNFRFRGTLLLDHLYVSQIPP